MSQCPCGSGKMYEECCLPIISHETPAPSAEALMRARYSAYTKADIDFIEESLLPSEREEFDRDVAENWAKQSEWLGLEVVSAEEDDKGETGIVEFKAKYTEKGNPVEHHERAAFKKEGGKWYFVDGAIIQEQYRREGPKVGRNEPCPCGSGKKFKKCCL